MSDTITLAPQEASESLGDLPLINPITGIAGGCCARTASGQAAAPLSSVMNWRHLRSSMDSSPEPAVPAYRRLRMPRKLPQVLGADLNRSESRRRRCQHRCPSNLKDSTAGYGERLLRCGISIRRMTAVGHSRPTRSKSHDRACPLCPRKRTNPVCLLCADIVVKVQNCPVIIFPR